jgi:hypothetical protein
MPGLSEHEPICGGLGGAGFALTNLVNSPRRQKVRADVFTNCDRTFARRERANGVPLDCPCNAGTPGGRHRGPRTKRVGCRNVRRSGPLVLRRVRTASVISARRAPVASEFAAGPESAIRDAGIDKHLVGPGAQGRGDADERYEAKINRQVALARPARSWNSPVISRPAFSSPPCYTTPWPRSAAPVTRRSPPARKSAAKLARAQASLAELKAARGSTSCGLPCWPFRPASTPGCRKTCVRYTPSGAMTLR